MSIIQRVPWTVQPQYPTQIDRGATGRGIASLTDVVNSTRQPTIVGTKVASRQLGLMRGYGATDGVGSTDKLTAETISANSTGVSVLFIATQNSAVSTTRLYSLNDSHVFTQAATQNLTFALSGGAPFWTTPALTTRPTVNVITYAGGTADPLMWRDGVSQTVTHNVGTRSGTIAAATSALQIGNRTAGDRVYDGSIGLLVWFNRILSDAEARSLSINPWQLFAPKTRKIFAVPLGVGGASPVAVQKVPWRVQPQGFVATNPKYAIRTLITPVGDNGVNMRSVVGNQWTANDITRVTRAVNKSGIILRQTIGFSAHWSRANTYPSSGPLTIGFTFTPLGLGNPNGMWQLGATSSGLGKVIVNSNSGSFRVYVGAAYVIDVAGVFTVGKRHDVVVSFSNIADSAACTVNAAVNGVSYTATGTHNATASTNEYYGIGFSSIFAGDYAEFFSTPSFWARELAARVSSNIYDIFAPQSRNLWVRNFPVPEVPTLSLPTLTSVASTTARPRVSVTF